MSIDDASSSTRPPSRSPRPNPIPVGKRFQDLLKKTLISISQEEPDLSQSLFGGTLIGVDPVEHLKAPREAKSMVSTLEN